MAFVDGSSSGSLSGMRWAAYGASTICEVIAVSPSVGIHVPSTAVPLNVVVANTGTGGTDVQFQVATDAAFASVVAAPSTSAAPNGPLTRTATGLSPATGYYWRARGADTGTTGWGPWSATMDFVVDLNAGKAFGYVNENLGVTPTLYAGESGYVDENMGVELTLYAGEADYIFANYGVQVTIRSFDYEYVYEGDVSTHQPTPHIWFLWLPYGLANDEVWAYGAGFGNPQSEYAGQLRVDPGPDYAHSADVSAVVNEWYLQEAVAHAYDDQRHIYPGAEGVDPSVTMQVEIIRWVAPDTIVPPVTPTNHLVYVNTTGHTSNRVPWLMYPTIPVGLGNVPQPLRTVTVVRVSDNTYDGPGIEQTLTRFSMPAYTVIAGRPERRAALSAGASSSAMLGTWSVQEALANALDVDLKATRRWLADPAKVVAHPELGTGVSLWVPSVGTAAMAWRLDDQTSPYIDPAYVIDSRMGELTVPAMVFPGDAWATLTADIHAGPFFAFAMVAVLHPPPKIRSSTLLGTFVNGTATTGAQSMSLSLAGDKISLLTGGRLASQNLQNVSRRPVVISGTISDKNIFLYLLDASPTGTSIIRHPLMNGTNLRLYMGRDDQGGTLLKPAAMDVLEFVYWDDYIPAKRLWQAQNKLDGIYGISGGHNTGGVV
jgi:hypothetical protein